MIVPIFLPVIAGVPAILLPVFARIIRVRLPVFAVFGPLLVAVTLAVRGCILPLGLGLLTPVLYL
jgi:hypothetical protein